MKGTIVFIHGAWMTPKCWEKFSGFFEALGYSVLAPAWPGKEGSVEDQKLHPSEKLQGLGVQEIVESYAAMIRALPEPPILIGHSFGGLFVQMLLDRGLGKAGIAIDSVAPKGVFALYPSVLRGMSFPLFAWKGWKRVLTISLKNFAYSFVHTLDPADQKRIYDEYVVPETGRIFWQAAFAPLNSAITVNYANPSRPSLLLIAGSDDHIVPAQMDRETYAKYLKHSSSKARVDFKEFPGRTHWIIADKGFEEVAAYCAEWVDELSK